MLLCFSQIKPRVYYYYYHRIKPARGIYPQHPHKKQFMRLNYKKRIFIFYNYYNISNSKNLIQAVLITIHYDVWSVRFCILVVSKKINGWCLIILIIIYMCNKLISQIITLFLGNNSQYSHHSCFQGVLMFTNHFKPATYL